MQKQLLRALINVPLTFNSLVVETTNRCNARCAICYQSSGPKGSDILGLSNLSIPVIKRIIREAGKIDTMKKRFHLAGGEVFLDIDKCIQLVEYAKKYNYLIISTTTNAFWASNKNKAKDVSEKLRKAGLTNIEISWDYWHKQYIDPNAINNCINACKDVGIEVNLRLLSTKSHSHGEALSFLQLESVERADMITCGVVFPEGRAKKEIEPSDFFKKGIEGSCHSALNLTVSSSGNVYPCCAGIDQTDKYIFGNVKEKSIIEIVATMNRSQIFRTLAFLGVKFFIPILEKAGINIGKREEYGNPCDLCCTIFSRSDCVKVIKNHFDKLEKQALIKAVEYLKDKSREVV